METVKRTNVVQGGRPKGKFRAKLTRQRVTSCGDDVYAEMSSHDRIAADSRSSFSVILTELPAVSCESEWPKQKWACSPSHSAKKTARRSQDEVFMPIRVKCVCQQQFDAPDHLAGKTVKCPKCAAPISIPRPVAVAKAAPAPPSAMASLLDEAGVKQRSAAGCPSCGAPFAPDAVLCVECGYNFRTNRKLETKFVATSAMDGTREGHGVNAEFLINKANEDMAAEKLMQKKLVSFGIPWWGYTLILIGIIGFIIGMGSLPQNQAMYIAACIMWGVGGLMMFVGRIWLMVASFKVGIVWFLVVFIAPFGEFIFAFANWDEGAAPFAIFFGGIVVFCLGYAAFILSGMLVPADSPTVLHWIQTAIPV